MTVATPGTVGDVPMVDEYVEALDAARDVALEHLATLPERRVTDRDAREAGIRADLGELPV